MQFFKDITHIFFPNICSCCDNVLTSNEITVCTQCIYDLPLTNYTLENSDFVKKVFYGRIQLEQATALFLYQKKGIVQNLIHNLKYRGHQEIGIFIGKWLGQEMKKSNNYEDIDYIIPVPLHKKRFKERGYNQLTQFGKQLSKELEIKYLENILVRKTTSRTQTKKIRTERWKNVIELFYLVDLSIFENKHILLIDDIITTGATLESCSTELLKTKNLKISIAVMAITV